MLALSIEEKVMVVEPNVLELAVMVQVLCVPDTEEHTTEFNTEL